MGYATPVYKTGLSVGVHVHSLPASPDAGRKHGALCPQKPLRLIRDGEVGGSGIFVPNTYSLRCHHQNDSALKWAAVWAILMFD